MLFGLMGSAMSANSFSPESFPTFGDLLKYLRRREHLTQLELSIAVGYSEAQISRLEQNQRLPDLAALKALFIPALHLENEPELTARILQLAQAARQEDSPVPGMPPYKGLLFFEQADSNEFFGREALTEHLAERVRELASEASVRFLAVIGASGSGKSSLVRAGLAASLQRAGWEIHTFTPTVHPLKMLADNYDSSIQRGKTVHLVLVDQFEEMFTHCRDDRERSAFIEALLSIAGDPLTSTTVVIALRADFYSHCAQYAELRKAVAAQQEYIGQMTEAELRRAVEEPARRGGWELEPGLVQILLNDVGADGTGQPEPGALPLLSHALLATWERRRGRTLTTQGYRASGGVLGAIAETAESVFTDRLDSRQQDLARDIFLRLTELGEGTEDTRRRAGLNELMLKSEEAVTLRGVLNTLAEARLITLNEDSAEVAHEALIREWQRLREWLTQDREGLRLHRHLTNSAHEWEARGRDPAELYRGARLAQLREWTLTKEGQLNALERAFLEASTEREQRDTWEREALRRRELMAAQELARTQSRAAKQLRRQAVFLAGAFVLAILLAGVAIFFGDQANQNAATAQDNARIAQQNSRIAEQNAASADASAQKAESERSLATSRELAAAAVSNLDLDPQLSILLSLQALKTSQTLEAENALHRSILTSRMVLTLRPNGGWVWHAAFSPDSKRLATSCDNKTAELWDATTGLLLLKLVGHTDAVTDIIFSPDGKRIATSSLDDTVRVWDAATGKEVFTLSGHQGFGVMSVEYSPDSKLLATAGADDRTVRIWDAATGQAVRVLHYAEDLQAVTFSPDGKRLAAGAGTWATRADEAKVVIWDLSTGKESFELSPGELGTIAWVAFSPDGTRLAAASYFADQAIVWDLSTRQELARFTSPAVVGYVTFSPDSRWLAVGGGSNTAKIYDLTTREPLFSLAGHTAAIGSVAFSPDGKRVVTASNDGTASVWDLTPLREALYVLAPAKDGSGIWRMAYSPDGKHIVANRGDHTTKAWDAQLGTEVPVWGSAAGNHALFGSYRPGGTLVQVGLQGGTAAVIDPQTGSMGPALSRTVDPTGGVAISPDGTRFVNYTLDSTITVWDLRSGKEISSFQGVRAGTVNNNGVDCVYFGVDSGGMGCVTFSPDGERLATSDPVTSGSNNTYGSSVTIWDAARGRPLLTLPAHIGTVWDLSFSPDGKRLVAAGDQAADIWDAVTGKLLLTVPSPSGSVWNVKFSPDGKEIATIAGDGGSVELWDATTAENLLELPTVGTNYRTDLAFSPDGKYLAVSDATGIHVFILPIDNVVALATSRLTRSLTTAECQKYLHVQSCPASP